MENKVQDVITDFGNEWKKFDQSQLSNHELELISNEYFKIFPWQLLSDNSQGFDLGCGSGRWAKIVAPKVGHLHCIDPSNAIEVAKKNLNIFSNCSFHQRGVDDIPFDENSMDFAYSLGVLHHIPDTAVGIKSCVSKLKKGAPFLVYLYYSFDNQPTWFRAIWRISDIFRRLISVMPFFLKFFFSQIIAVFIYYPLAKLSRFYEILGGNVHSFPLSSYRFKSFYTMQTDALDRFGTRLEHRYSKVKIKKMMEDAGLSNIVFSDTIPFWVAVGIKK
ncbi:MAG: class I SAM-dependent methyltransferase [Bacteroidetes bacterium]|nr:class I SAM-dependent methyltransferase [bacterium]NBP65992.1 class I SAM-dependent methyltransferase [Bacteroidota bacterium]